MALLTVSDLAVSAGGELLLEGLSLEVEVGRLVAVVGPSGSGKTTLLRALAFLADPERGTVELGGRPPEHWGWPGWRRRVCYVAQRPVLLDATVRENLERPFAYGTAEGPFPEDRAREHIERLGLEPSRMDQNARTLSEGQQQRVALARALLVEPSVLLLDEPTSALDPEALSATENLVSDVVRESEAGALVVTHDRAQAERWCDETLDLSEWRAHG